MHFFQKENKSCLKKVPTAPNSFPSVRTRYVFPFILILDPTQYFVHFPCSVPLEKIVRQKKCISRCSWVMLGVKRLKYSIIC